MRKLYFILLFPTLFIFSQNKYPTHQWTGRFHLDVNSYKFDTLQLFEQKFRRLFLGVIGNLEQNVSYFIRMDFSQGTIKLRNAYISFGSLPYTGGELMIGNIQEVPSLDVATSGRDINIQERAFISSTQPSRYRTGIKYQNTKLLKNKAALFFDISFNEGILKNTYLKNNRNTALRITYAPILNEKHLLHLGAHYENRKFPGNNYAIKIYPANSRITLPKIKYSIDYAVLNEDLGAEFAATYGPVGTEAEYEISNVLRDSVGTENNYYTTNFHWDIFFFLTGEQKKYKNGAFSKVVPKHKFNLSQKHFGAWEIVARYDVMDFRNAYNIPLFYGNSINKIIKHYIFGINFYPTDKIRLMYNYIIADIVKDNKIYSHSFRLAYDF